MDRIFKRRCGKSGYVMDTIRTIGSGCSLIFLLRSCVYMNERR